MSISDHERMLTVFAEELECGIASCYSRIGVESEWIDNHQEAEAIMTRIRGIFVASLVGEVEEKIGRAFSTVFDQLSDRPTLPSSKYWFVDMPKKSTLRGRARVMWAIRIAYTHGNGLMTQIDNKNVADRLEPKYANSHFRGIRVKTGTATIFGDVTFPALKTALAICDQFSSNNA
jgi:hypothetical protein